MVPTDSFKVSRFSKTSGGIWETTLREMADVSMKRAKDCSGERPTIALPKMHSQMILWLGKNLHGNEAIT